MTTMHEPTAPAPPAEEGPEGPEGDWPGADRELLDATVAFQVQQNRAHAHRLQTVHRFHARRVDEQRRSGPRPGTGFFGLTPLRVTQAEVAPLLGTGELTVQVDLDTVEGLTRWLPRLWDRCLTGRLDLARALACLGQLGYLADDTARAAYATAIQGWFDKHDPPDQPDRDRSDGGLCRLTRDRVARAARYQRLKLPQREDSETFAQAFRKRRVTLRHDPESAMATLTGVLAAHDAITANHRLTMIAKKRSQAPGETRTLDQLRADSLLDLLHGRLTVPATTGDLEHHQGCDTTCRVTGTDDEPDPCDPGDGTGPGGSAPAGRVCPLHPLVLTGDTGGPLGGYARPVIQVTVPISTLTGAGNAPGLLSGGIPIPADYARHIAIQPGSTWYRMLTDDAGTFVALSTTSYQPTDPMCREITGRDHTCVWPGCRRPAVVAHLDHNIPHPEGETSTDNLQPLCERHHQVKHADGYAVTRHPDGSYTWTTRYGSTLTTPASEQPTDPLLANPPAEPPESRPSETDDAKPDDQPVDGDLNTAPDAEPVKSDPDAEPPAEPPAEPVDGAPGEETLSRAEVDELFAAITGPLEHALAGLIATHSRT